MIATWIPEQCGLRAGGAWEVKHIDNLGVRNAHKHKTIHASEDPTLIISDSSF